MLSSIHPLGERARHNRWGLTAGALTLGALGSGAAAGTALGWAGAAFLPGGGWRWTAVLAVVAAAGAADLIGIKPPGPRRQVNEDWIGTYRGWVYGLGFGGQLGVGLATFVVSWGVWATAVLATLSGGAIAGALIGGAFGAGRAALPLAAGWIDRPSRLTAFTSRLSRWATPAARTVATAFLLVAVAGMVIS